MVNFPELQRVVPVSLKGKRYYYSILHFTEVRKISHFFQKSVTVVLRERILQIVLVCGKVMLESVTTK